MKRIVIEAEDVDAILSLIEEAGCDERETDTILTGESGEVECENARIRFEWSGDRLIVEVKKRRS